MSALRADHDGASPNKTPTTMVNASAKINTGQSSAKLELRGS
jgi:hypothetical protein